jgi:hypothetical protein
VIIGGLASSLALTLLLVPIVYMWLAPKRLEQIEEVPPQPPGPVIELVRPPAPPSVEPEVAARHK